MLVQTYGDGDRALTTLVRLAGVDATTLTNANFGGLAFTPLTDLTLTGTEGADVLSGGAGNDVIRGGHGADTLTGGFGDDHLVGDDGTTRTDLPDMAAYFGPLSKALVTGLGGDVGFGEAAVPFYYWDTVVAIPVDFNSGTITQGGAARTGISVSQDGVVTIGTMKLSAVNTYLVSDYMGSAGEGGNSTGSGRVWYDFDAATATITITWDDIHLPWYYYQSAPAAIQMQVKVLGADSFDVVYRYEQFDWPHTYGGPHITIDGKTVAFALPGGTTADLDTAVGNDGQPGVLVAQVRGGAVETGIANEGDTLDGGDGNDLIEGGAGDDRLTGGRGADTLTGGAGRDTFVDTYYDDSVDTVTDFQAGVGGDVFEAQRTLAYNTIGLRQSGADTLIVAMYYANYGNPAEKVIARLLGVDAATLVPDNFNGFALARLDDQVLTGTSGNDVLTGGWGTDTISGGGGNDRIDGGKGVDRLTGGDGRDTFVAASYDNETDIITDFQVGVGGDVIEASRSYGAGKVALYQDGADTLVQVEDHLYYPDRTELRTVFRLTGVSATSLVPDNFGGRAIVLLGDATYVGTAGDEVLTGGPGAQVLLGGGGNDTLTGGPGADTIDGGAGDDIITDLVSDDATDTLTGGAGRDEYRGFDLVRAATRATDIITDFTPGADGDVIRIAGATDNPFLSQVLSLRQAGADTQILVRASDGSAHVAVLLRSVDARALTAENFGGYAPPLLQPVIIDDGDDGHVLTGGLVDDVIRGNGGNDTIAGLDGNDRLAGGSGDDTIDGGAGNDMLAGESGNDTLTGGAGSDILSGGSGDDVLTGSTSAFGNDGNDIFDGGHGDDRLVGSLGNDLYRFARGDGRDTIVDAGGTDAIEFTTGVTAADISVVQVGGDIELRVGDDGGRIRILGGFSTAARIESVRFADGTRWSWADVLARSMQAGAGDDTLTLIEDSATPELIVNGSFEQFDPARASNDWWGHNVAPGGVPGWTEATGLNLYLVYDGADGLPPTDGDYWVDLDHQQNRAIGQHVQGLTAGQTLLLQFDYVNRRGTPGGAIDVVWNGQVVAHVTDATQAVQTGTLTLTALSGDNVIAFRGVGTAGLWDASLDNVRLHMITSSASATPLSGLDGNDTLTGSPLDDVIIGGTGDDRLAGGAGNDSYRFARGDGQDTIDDSQGANRIVFDAGIAPGDVSLVRSQSTIVLQIAGTGDRIDLGRGAGANLGFAAVFADGTVWNAATLTAMALATTTGDDIVFATHGDDVIDGLAGDDVLHGGDGNDVLSGGTGTDRLEGGAGDDSYRFARGDGDDTIADTGGCRHAGVWHRHRAVGRAGRTGQQWPGPDPDGRQRRPHCDPRLAGCRDGSRPSPLRAAIAGQPPTSSRGLQPPATMSSLATRATMSLPVASATTG